MEEDDYWEQFVTGVGLITSRIKSEDNIMAAAWTYQVSYEPGLIAVCINPNHETAKIIDKSKVFGVNLVSEEQNVLSSIAGGKSGEGVDKISLLKELGYEFSEGRKIKVLMIKDSALGLECKLKKKIKLGDHIMYVGEVVSVHLSEKTVAPLAYRAGKYFKLGGQIMKPEQKVLDKIDELVKKHTKK